MIRSLSVFALALALAACESPKRRVALDFVTNTSGDVKGFQCIDQDGEQPGPLWQRGLMGDAPDLFVRTNLVIDFVRLGGTPTCRPSQLQQWCEDESCEVIREARVCYPLDVLMVPGERFGVTFDRVLEELRGTKLVENAPDEDVLVRMVGTTQSCQDIDAGAPLQCESLIGCAHSCPVNLDRQTDELILDLDGDGTHCRELVELCASPGFSAGSACTES